MTGPRPKLLTIDGERLLVEGLEKVLEKRGFDVRFALSGKEGLEQLANDIPDVVLVDLRMPEMGGLEVLREIRKKHAQLPVIVMTA